jgi:hypothetical protein
VTAGSINTTKPMPITWSLSGVTLSDGSVATGSFVYDANHNTYSAINITTSAGSVFSGATFTAIDASQMQFISGSFAVFVTGAGLANYTGTRAIVFFFSPALTNSGGRVLLNTSTLETTCADVNCTAAGPTSRTVTVGSVTASTTPGPAAVPALSNVGLATLALLLTSAATILLRRSGTAAQPPSGAIG